MAFSQLYAVTVVHTKTYADPIRVAQGDRVVVGRVDQEWPGWLWCTNRQGQSGWIAETLLTRAGGEAVVSADYSAEELTVQVGEVIKGGQALDGWIWCQNSAGAEGWVPVRNLRRMA